MERLYVWFDTTLDEDEVGEVKHWALGLVIFIATPFVHEWRVTNDQFIMVTHKFPHKIIEKMRKKIDKWEIVETTQVMKK